MKPEEQQEEETKIEPNENLVRINQLASGYVYSAIEREFPALRFNPGGIERFSSCLGFIVGIQIGNLVLANSLADSFIRCFDMVKNNEKRRVQHSRMEFPESIMVIGDDGCPFSMTFSLWHFACDQSLEWEHVVKFRPTNSWSYSGDEAKYVREFHGGIILHGFGQTHSVQLSPSIGWSVHT